MGKAESGNGILVRPSPIGLTSFDIYPIRIRFCWSTNEALQARQKQGKCTTTPTWVAIPSFECSWSLKAHQGGRETRPALPTRGNGQPDRTVAIARKSEYGLANGLTYLPPKPEGPLVRGNRLAKTLMGIWLKAATGKLPARPGPRTVGLLALLVCLSIGAAASVFLGQDASWDLKNYHLYLGYGAMSGRISSDFLNTQMYLNPILDTPYAWLALGPLSDHPRILAAIMGLWYGALITIVWMLARGHYVSWPSTRRYVAVLCSIVVASTGTAVIAQVGTTSNEIQDSIFVLVGLLILQTLIRAETSATLSNTKHISLPVGGLLATGALLGLATGLKLTASIYSPAACLALIGIIPFRRWMTWCLLIVAGWLPAFALGAGWWAWKLWTRFSNPYFPLLNGLFRSQWYHFYIRVS